MTTFRIEAREAAILEKAGDIIPNFENPMSFFEPNPDIGLSEAEYLFVDKIDPRYIYDIRGVK